MPQPERDRLAIEAMAVFLKTTPHDIDQCLEWDGNRNSEGYGRLWLGGRGGRNYFTHRLSYCVKEGEEWPTIDGWMVRHMCDNPPCCNPYHLVLGDNTQNVLDKVAAGRTARLKGTTNGRSKLTEENVSDIRYLDRKGIPHTEIADLYGVSVVHIGRIVRFEQRTEG